VSSSSREERAREWVSARFTGVGGGLGDVYSVLETKFSLSRSLNLFRLMPSFLERVCLPTTPHFIRSWRKFTELIQGDMMLLYDVSLRKLVPTMAFASYLRVAHPDARDLFGFIVGYLAGKIPVLQLIVGVDESREGNGSRRWREDASN
jgi:hypothetical protein